MHDGQGVCVFFVRRFVDFHIVPHEFKCPVWVPCVSSNMLLWINSLFWKFLHTTEIDTIRDSQSYVTYTEILGFCGNKDFDDLFSLFIFVSRRSTVGFFWGCFLPPRKSPWFESVGLRASGPKIASSNSISPASVIPSSLRPIANLSLCKTCQMVL